MGDVRDPLRDQQLPRAGRLPVQAIMIDAIEERREYGMRKYGRPLETHNGRDALTDAWEEALDLFTYLTQVRLERGDVLPGMREGVNDQKPLVKALHEADLARCEMCNHEPHAPGRCTSRALSMPCSCGPR